MTPRPEYALVPASEKDSVEEPFLTHAEDGDACRVCTARRSQRAPRLRWVMLHVGVAALYMAVIGGLFAAYLPRGGHEMDPHEYAPAKKVLSYAEANFETSYEGNPYAGEPRPEHEEAWYDLLKDSQIRVTGDELGALNQTSLRLKSGGYVAQLGVFHQLHCVKWVRQWMHRKHYWPELHGVMLEERRRHIDHCLEMFRFHFMCHPDVSLGTYKWFGSHPTPGLEHRARCANWDALADWRDQRALSLKELDDLADRPPTEEWEPTLDVILGQSKGRPGEVDRYSQALVEAEPPLIAALYHPPDDDLV